MFLCIFCVKCFFVYFVWIMLWITVFIISLQHSCVVPCNGKIFGSWPKLEVKFDLLCGRPIGHITRLAHLSVCLSICPIWARNSKTKKHRKTKIDIAILSGMPIFQLKRSRVKVTGRKKPHRTASCLFMDSRSSAGGSSAHC